MTVIDAHKRIDAYRTVVTGREAHSALPELGVNAISGAAELIVELDRIGEAFAASASNDRFEPPVSTMQVGTIEGGTAANIVPKSCRFQWQIRSLPSADPETVPDRLGRYGAETVLPRMQRNGLPAAIDTTHLGSVPAFVAKPGSEAVAPGAVADRRQRDQHRLLRHRGRAVRGGRLPDSDLRSRGHRPGPCRGRIRRRGAARGLHGVSRQARRPARGLGEEA